MSIDTLDDSSSNAEIESLRARVVELEKKLEIGFAVEHLATVGNLREQLIACEKERDDLKIKAQFWLDADGDSRARLAACEKERDFAVKNAERYKRFRSSQIEVIYESIGERLSEEVFDASFDTAVAAMDAAMKGEIAEWNAKVEAKRK
jgi:hypothetical protein